MKIIVLNINCMIIFLNSNIFTIVFLQSASYLKIFYIVYCIHYVYEYFYTLCVWILFYTFLCVEYFYIHARVYVCVCPCDGPNQNNLSQDGRAEVFYGDHISGPYPRAIYLIMARIYGDLDLRWAIRKTILIPWRVMTQNIWNIRLFS